MSSFALVFIFEFLEEVMKEKGWLSIILRIFAFKVMIFRWEMLCNSLCLYVLLLCQGFCRHILTLAFGGN